MKQYLFIFLITVLSACSYFKKGKLTDADIIAQVKDEYLYASDLESLTRGLKGQDSITTLKLYAEGWVRKKLLLQKAIDNIGEDDPGIARKIEDYRESLLLYEYEKALVNQKLDTVIKQQELVDWHEKLKLNFPLQNDVYQLFYIKLKSDAPDVDQARKWIMKTKDEEEERKLTGYIKEFATSSVMDKGMWYTKEYLVKNFPLSEYDVTTLSNSNNFKEIKTDEGQWFIRIGAQMKKDDPSPLEFVREQIVRAIIEKRRLLLIEKVYNKVYADCAKSKSYEVFVK